ncbi:heme b synthase [Desulfacinum hydrothermale DSM 13146]|uniref:Heme b synthase n=1 Tax=Desulfacinum hydrothermale DSM 13146 TaxID=1121390 RepID=A0A1W1XLY6_9BACT|nr:heme b synthase [Desulfacinum hydrothermale]SMC24864.1 heme b synthase [Desulfacinum hydrothermale DSM 13146]
MDRQEHRPPAHPNGSAKNSSPGSEGASSLRLVAWEVTRTCNLSCIHCRAAALDKPYDNELSSQECRRVLDEIASFAKPIIILTGGEPLMRPDIFELAAYGNELGLRMTMAPNGTLVTQKAVRKMVESGIQRISISLDGATAESHDAFRRVPGAFEGALRGIRNAREVGLPFQINTTITAHNLHELEAIQKLAVDLGAVAHHIFLLVPTGRGKNLEEQAINAVQYEETLHWFYEQRDRVPLQLKATCAPHYYRILRQRARKEGKKVDMATFGLDAMTRGCLGGTGFCFLSHVGQVQPCGYLEVEAGNVRTQSFREIWETSPVFLRLRNFKALEGKCGRCEYVRVCGGCRARAFEATGNYMAEEPLCLYEPRQADSGRS